MVLILKWHCRKPFLHVVVLEFDDSCYVDAKQSLSLVFNSQFHTKYLASLTNRNERFYSIMRFYFKDTQRVSTRNQRTVICARALAILPGTSTVLSRSRPFIKQLLNSVFAWYHELSKPRVCIICRSIIIHFLNNRKKKTFSHSVSEENTPRGLVTRQKLNLTW